MKKTLVMVIFLLLSCHRPVVVTHDFDIVSKCSLPGYSKDLDLKGDYAYVANDQGGLQIIDIADPETTFVVGAYVSQKNFQGIAVRDSFAYIAVAASDGGMAILDVKDPEEPVLLGADPWFYAYNVTAPAQDSKYVYVAARYWFLVEDVQDPRYPSFVRRFSTPGNVRDVFMVDSFAYLACEQMGLIVYDLSNPDSTAKVSELDTPSNARSLFVEYPYVYVADGLGGLVIIDITDLDDPVIIGRYDTPGYAQSVHVVVHLAYIADREGGLQVVDVTAPESPELYGKLDTPYAYRLLVKDDYIYLVDRDMGLVVIREVSE